MNKCILIGNLCADPEAFTTQSGVSRSSMKVAVQRPFKREETDFLTVIAWRQTADYCNKYIKKGNKVGVVGSVQTRSYDAQDGSKRYVTEIIAESVEGLTRPDGAPQDGHKPARETHPQNDFPEVDPGDELPF